MFGRIIAMIAALLLLIGNASAPERAGNDLPVTPETQKEESLLCPEERADEIPDAKEEVDRGSGDSGTNSGKQENAGNGGQKADEPKPAAPSENGGAQENGIALSAQEQRREAFEQEVLRLVNEERAAYGLPALTYSRELRDGAREKSEDMQRNRYFSHTSPTYGSPFDQMQARGIRYRSAGENIAMGYATPEAVMRAWMNSEGHRANILSKNFTELGVGYVENGNYVTQWFRG